MSDLDPIRAGFRGAAVRMSPADLAVAAQANGYELAVVEAVLDTESSGSGFDSAGRPKILTEPHVFYRLLAPEPAKLAKAVSAGVAYPRQGEKPYPVGSNANYQRLVTMCSIDAPAALQATSWGIAQVMGFNYTVCGFADVFGMVRAAMASEVAQFDFLLKYVARNHLDVALREKRFSTFADGYNGPGAVAAYTAKLETAYARHSAETPVAAQAIASPALRQAPLDANALNEAEWLQIRGGESPGS